MILAAVAPDISKHEQTIFCFVTIAYEARASWLKKILFLQHYLFVTVATIPKVFYLKRAFVIVFI